MVEHWIELTNLPAHGREFSFEDQDMWLERWQEFHLEVKTMQPIMATVTVFPQGEGYLISGRLTAALKTMCHRCTDDARIELDHSFDTFEAQEDAQSEPDGEVSHLRCTDSGWELNIADLLWEEFLLAMPEKILCSDTCLGLCPHCGKNRNQDHCVCSNLDSRSPLAKALQGVKIKTN